ncbi:MAG: SMC-Scp complex subunit ScpB [Bdellovibrio sp.]|nr:SMC-Scp complex subunit ScpB [Bdellovibrio sp.]
MARKKKAAAAVEEETIVTLAEEISAEVEATKEESAPELDLESEGTLSEGALFLSEEEEQEGFIPEAADDEAEVEDLLASDDELAAADAAIEGTELDNFESAEIEDLEFVEDEQIQSIIESILFASDRPVSLASIQQVFKGTTVKKDKIRRTIEALAVDYAGGRRGIVLEEITGGYQLRTKVDNMNFLKRTIKSRAFKLSGPALETLSIIAYKQPVVKIEVDQIRGVESGHLLRALMEKGLVNFEGKAENLPGKPMTYGTTRRFLEIFGLRNLKELPTLSQIDELLPEGIGEEVEEKQTLSMVTDSMADHSKTTSYSQGEEELGDIENQLTAITTSSEFFEQEKLRQKMKRDEEKAQNIREALTVGEVVPKKDINWLKKYDEAILQAAAAQAAAVESSTNEPTEAAIVDENTEANEISLADAAITAADEESDADLDNEYNEDEAEMMASLSTTADDSDSDDDDELFADAESDELPMYEEADEDAGNSSEGHV